MKYLLHCLVEVTRMVPIEHEVEAESEAEARKFAECNRIVVLSAEEVK